MYIRGRFIFKAVEGLIKVREGKVRMYIQLIACHIPDPSASLEIVVRVLIWALCSIHRRQSATIVVMTGAA